MSDAGSGITRDDWLRALDDANISHTDDQSAVTIREFAELVELPEYTARRLLHQLVKKGRAKQTTKMGLGSDGRRALKVAFKLLDRQPKKADAKKKRR